MRYYLRNRFVLHLLLTMVLLLGLILLCFTITKNNIVWQAQRNIQNVMSDTVSRVSARVSNAVDIGNTISNISTLSRFALATPDEQVDLRDNMRFLLSSFIGMQEGMKEIYVYMADGSCLSVTPESEASNEHIACFTVKQSIFNDFDLTIPYRNYRITKSYDYGGRKYYALFIPIYPSRQPSFSGRYLGTLVFLYGADSLKTLLPSYDTVDSVIMDGDEVLAEANELSAFEWRSEPTDGVLRERIQGTGWTVLMKDSVSEVGDTITRLRLLCIIIAVCTVVVFSILTQLQYKRIVGPIIALSRRVASLNDDENGLIDELFNIVELDGLVKNINRMLVTQRSLAKEMMQIKMDYYEERIIFLQAQINPHFLYNSFECIRGMAGAGDAAQVREAASLMAAIYRYCSQSAPYATLREECECINKYARMTQLCYRNLYSLELSVGDDMRELVVPRMLLQPLVENAVRHGFTSGNRKMGTIYIEAHREDALPVIRVADDGVGMSDEQMRRLNGGEPPAETGASTNIGIANVMKRLKLMYGNQVKITFARAEAGGLEITIRIPASAEEKTNKPD